MQLSLPLRLGGCGLPIPSPTLSDAARLSSAALTQAALQQGPAIFRPFDRPHCAILQQTWETLKTTAPDLCSPKTATLQAALEHGTLAQAQHSFGHHEAQRAYEALLRTADGFSPTTRMLVLSRLRSVACRAASAWLETLPTAPPLRLDDGAFRAALRRRLGESNLPSGSPDATCFYRTSLRATDAEHALTCRSPNALRVLRHDDIVDVVRRMLRRGGLPSTKEPRLPVLNLQGPSSARPPPQVLDRQREHVATCSSPWRGSSGLATSPSSTPGPQPTARPQPRLMEAPLPAVTWRRRLNTGGMERAATILCP
jgi:hypothetical protein